MSTSVNALFCSSLLIPTLTQWVEITDLVVYDSAMTNHIDRPDFIQLVACDKFVHRGLLSLDDRSFTNWLILRRIKVANLNLSKLSKTFLNTTFLSYFSTLTFMSCIELENGTDFDRLFEQFKGVLRGIKINDIGLIFLKFPNILLNITTIEFRDFENSLLMDIPLDDVIKSLPNISSLCFSGGTCQKILDFVDKCVDSYNHQLTNLKVTGMRGTTLRKLAFSCPNLLSFSLFSTVGIHDDLVFFFENCKNITDIELRDGVSDRVLSSILTHCHNIVSLQIHGKKLSIANIAEKCSNLKKLHLCSDSDEDDNSQTDDETVIRMEAYIRLFRSNPNLVSVEIDTELSDSCVSFLIGACPKMEHFRLTSTSCDPYLRIIEQIQLEKIEFLDHGNCEDCYDVIVNRTSTRNKPCSLSISSEIFELSSEFLVILATLSPQLKIINFLHRKIDNCNDDILSRVFTLCDCLHSISLHGDNEGLTENVLLIMAKKYRTQLIKLILIRFEFTHKIFSIILSRVGKNLKYLGLSCCTLTDKDVLKIVDFCPVLKQLDLSCCSKVTNNTMISLIKSLKHSLTHLDVGFCILLTDSFFHELSLTCSLLIELNAQGCMKIANVDQCKSYFIDSSFPFLEKLVITK